MYPVRFCSPGESRPYFVAVPPERGKHDLGPVMRRRLYFHAGSAYSPESKLPALQDGYVYRSTNVSVWLHEDRQRSRLDVKKVEMLPSERLCDECMSLAQTDGAGRIRRTVTQTWFAACCAQKGTGTYRPIRPG